MKDNKTRVVLYEDKYRDQLEELLMEFSVEVFSSGSCDVDLFIESHWAVYLAVRGDKIVGFSSFVYNSYYGLREPTIGNSYIYVVPICRTGRAMYLFSLQAGKICLEHNLSLEHYYSSDSSEKLSRKLDGKKLYETYIYEVNEVERAFSSLNKKIKIKD